jgi:hypothetical protein
MKPETRSLLVYLTIGVTVGAGCAIASMAITGTYQPPLWYTLTTGVVAALIADQAERWDRRRTCRRAHAHVEGPRPTNPDGTPYGYHQIRAGGWEHCDGCGLWGRTWTPENPHQCQETYINGPVTNRKANR